MPFWDLVAGVATTIGAAVLGVVVGHKVHENELGHINHRLDRIEEKLDRMIERELDR